MPAPAVLVVDDEQLIRWSIRERLEQAGFPVVVADCGKEAMSCFGDDVGLVLLDLKLPDTNGLVLLREFKQRRPDCKVIVMTAYGTPEAAREAFDCGALRVVDKPFDLEQMTHWVEKALGRA